MLIMHWLNKSFERSLTDPQSTTIEIFKESVNGLTNGLKIIWWLKQISFTFQGDPGICRWVCFGFETKFIAHKPNNKIPGLKVWHFLTSTRFWIYIYTLLNRTLQSSKIFDRNIFILKKVLLKLRNQINKIVFFVSTKIWRIWKILSLSF